MLRFWASLIKEILLLIRDKSGLAILFFMPVALVTIMALVQDAPFRDYQELDIPTLILNQDKGAFGQQIIAQFDSSRMFSIVEMKEGEENLKKEIAQGKYDIGIVIPDGISTYLQGRSKAYAEQILSELGVAEVSAEQQTTDSTQQIGIFFRPGVKQSFRQAVLQAIRQESSRLETATLIHSFKSLLGAEDSETSESPFGNFVAFRERPVGPEWQQAKQTNSVQHNVPAWTMFGMFFIVISLAGSIIREREEGSYLRILTMPGSYLTVLFGKMTAYLIVCLTQCALMLGVGILFLPLLGLPSLDMQGMTFLNLAIVAISCGLAAVGFGVLTGTVFQSHQQASTFGSVSVVILAALGGIWVPVYVMPVMIQSLAEWSPLFWGLNAFQHVFLGDGHLQPMAHYLIKLDLFFVLCVGLSVLINRARQQA